MTDAVDHSGARASGVQAGGCPVAHGDERKTAALASQRIRPNPGAKVVTDFRFAQHILRHPSMMQAGAGAEFVDLSNPEQVSFFFLDGELHRKKRAQVARYFHAEAIEQRYLPVMERVMNRLLADLRKGPQQLDLMSFQMAVEVAAEVVGLTETPPDPLARRIRRNFDSMSMRPKGPVSRMWQKALQTYRALNFFYRDVKPAIRARKRGSHDDVISHLVKEGYTDQAILLECMTYATAGMMTTREFIVAASWHLFERPEVRERFLEGNETEQLGILYEILRMEPVAGMIHRRATEDWTGPNGEVVKAGEVYAINLRGVNTDEKSVGECPFSFDDSRAKRMKTPPMWMSFAAGPHTCPGNLVAIHETRFFIDRLLRAPGVRLVTPPKIGWCDAVGGYELHGAMVACDPA
jgi:cytochrome P450